MHAGAGPTEGECTTGVGLEAQYAEQAVRADRYDPTALVNRGNVAVTRGDLVTARDLYREALRSDASCVEAAYNLALVYKRQQRYADALQWFCKLNVVLRNDAQVEFV